MHKKKKIAPSILAADFTCLGEQVKIVEDAGAKLIHVDVMDGHFVPNISIGPPVITSLRKVTRLFLDVHLMIENPADYIDAFVESGADHLTVHLETCPDVLQVIKLIKKNNITCGISINPSTPVSSLDFNFLDEVDLVLIMSVNPGFGGQKFIPETLTRLQEIQKILQRRNNNHINVEVDGGIVSDNIRDIALAGADVLVCGSSIFRTADPADSFRQLNAIINKE
jgi:ribulose-phosphate 3-epimerase